MRNDTAPATKGDVQKLVDRLDRLEASVKSSKDDLMEAFNASIATMLTKFDTKIAELKDGFRVIVEDAQHDVRGTRHDEIELLKDAKVDHEQRIRSLERKAETIAA